MDENWRTLIYPLGFLSSIAFAARFIIQWMQSEMQQKSVIRRSFWRLSLLGNVLLLLHAFVQLQYHVCAIQACNAVISWRNLNLMQNVRRHVHLKFVLILFFIAILGTTVAFYLQSIIWFDGQMHWLNIPTTPWQKSFSVSLFWHILGFFGIVLFSSRFWIQWWHAEKHKVSYLSPLFWWLSLVGAFLSFGYFFYIRDPVNAIGPAVGLLPYFRNLMLLKRTSSSELS